MLKILSIFVFSLFLIDQSFSADKIISDEERSALLSREHKHFLGHLETYGPAEVHAGIVDGAVKLYRVSNELTKSLFELVGLEKLYDHTTASILKLPMLNGKILAISIPKDNAEINISGFLQALSGDSSKLMTDNKIIYFTILKELYFKRFLLVYIQKNKDRILDQLKGQQLSTEVYQESIRTVSAALTYYFYKDMGLPYDYPLKSDYVLFPVITPPTEAPIDDKRLRVFPEVSHSLYLDFPLGVLLEVNKFNELYNASPYKTNADAKECSESLSPRLMDSQTPSAVVVEDNQGEIIIGTDVRESKKKRRKKRGGNMTAKLSSESEAALRTHYEELVRLLKEEEEALKQTKTLFESLEDESKKLRDKIRTAETYTLQATPKIEELAEENKLKKKEIDLLGQEKQKLQMDLDSLVQGSVPLSESKLKLSKEVAESNQKILEKNMTIERLNAAVWESEREYLDQKRQVEEELSRRAAELKKLEDEFVRLQGLMDSSLKTQEEEKVKLQEELGALKARRPKEEAQQKADLSQMSLNNTDLARLIDAEKNKARELEEEIQTMRGRAAEKVQKIKLLAEEKA